MKSSNKNSINNTFTDTKHIFLSDNNLLFIPEDGIIEFYHNVFNTSLDYPKLKYLRNIGLLPCYKIGNKIQFLKSDLLSVADSILVSPNDNLKLLKDGMLFETVTKEFVTINNHTRVDIAHDDLERFPVFFSAIRNLINSHMISSNVNCNDVLTMSYFPVARLNTTSEKIVEFANSQMEREKKSDMSVASQFARSAYYMGSKRSLCGFLIEAISSILPPSGVIVDLMCGSGVASGAFNKIWETYSSDAEQFCRILAVIHGGGFDRTKAKNLLEKILPIYKQHFKSLQTHLNEALEKEDNLFCKELNDILLNEYQHFLKDFPTLPNGLHINEWDPLEEVSRRKTNKFIFPYCLFTTYFANVYFGLRQCVEIDSIRYAIDQLKDENDKSWALGALIATVSALGTTYGGHFAQPPIRSYNDISFQNLSNVIDKRSSSITHEFSVRLLNLSEQSNHSERIIKIVPGPWENALISLEKKLKGKSVVVYLDAPYKREEYSRYYHVLETLVTYAYPSCKGKGLTPTTEDRFKSEFFTKDNEKITTSLVKIITTVLKKGWICAWSYSNSGVADISKVIELVYNENHCNINSYSVPFIHKAQGGAHPKNVTEFLIVFSPNTSITKLVQI